MKLLTLIFTLCVLLSCNTASENHLSTQETTTRDTIKAKQDTPASAEKQDPKTIFIASGFEPMWNLQLLKAEDGSYPINYVDVTGEMTGSLKKVSDDVFEGMIKQHGATGTKIKLVISNKPCMHEDGKTQDPYTATITMGNTTSSGCGRKL